MNFELIEKYRKGMSVERMHTVRHLTPYTNGSHSANAALLAHELCKLNDVPSGSVVLYMLLHDIAEGYVGDMPANVKWDNLSLASELSAVERRWEEENLDLPDLSWEEKHIAKAADYAELGFYCVEELMLGNKNVIPVLVNIIGALNGYMEVDGIVAIQDYLMKRGEV